MWDYSTMRLRCPVAVSYLEIINDGELELVELTPVTSESVSIP